MIEYLARGWAAFVIGFIPMAEIYVAVPAALAMGLDHVSAVAWSVAGNWAPIPLLYLLYDRLRQVERVRAYLDRLASVRVRAQVERGGIWFYLLLTPLIGTWALGVTVMVLGVRPAHFLLPSLLSVVGFAAAIAAAVAAGLEWLQ